MIEVMVEDKIFINKSFWYKTCQEPLDMLPL